MSSYILCFKSIKLVIWRPSKQKFTKLSNFDCCIPSWYYLKALLMKVKKLIQKKKTSLYKVKNLKNRDVVLFLLLYVRKNSEINNLWFLLFIPIFCLFILSKLAVAWHYIRNGQDCPMMLVKSPQIKVEIITIDFFWYIEFQ